MIVDISWGEWETPVQLSLLLFPLSCKEKHQVYLLILILILIQLLDLLWIRICIRICLCVYSNPTPVSPLSQ